MLLNNFNALEDIGFFKNFTNYDLDQWSIESSITPIDNKKPNYVRGYETNSGMGHISYLLGPGLGLFLITNFIYLSFQKGWENITVCPVAVDPNIISQQALEGFYMYIGFEKNCNLYPPNTFGIQITNQVIEKISRLTFLAIEKHGYLDIEGNLNIHPGTRYQQVNSYKDIFQND